MVNGLFSIFCCSLCPASWPAQVPGVRRFLASPGGYNTFFCVALGLTRDLSVRSVHPNTYLSVRSAHPKNTSTSMHELFAVSYSYIWVWFTARYFVLPGEHPSIE